MNYFIKIYNNWHTENNEDRIASIQAQTEANNTKAFFWATATLVIGLIL